MLVILATVAVVVAVGACGGGGSGGAVEPLRVRVRLENRDVHLYDVASVELNLIRGNVTVTERISAGPGRTLTFPVEAEIVVPEVTGALRGEAIARGADGSELGGGEGEAGAASGRISALTIELHSIRSRPSRGRTGTPDGGLDPDGPPASDGGGSPTPDAGPARMDARSGDGAGGGAGEAGTGNPDGGDSGAGGAGPPDAVADVPAPPCIERRHRLPATGVVSVDYGSVPRDAKDLRVAVSSGLDHNHVHDFVGWIRFDLTGVPDRAALLAMAVSLELEVRSTVPPRLGIFYSANDGWSPVVVASETAEMIARTARVSADLGPPLPRRSEYPVEVARYQQFWAADVADNAVTLGLVSLTPADAPETWAYFHGLAVPVLAPYLEVTTCE
jgi:hypothetical protein